MDDVQDGKAKAHPFQTDPGMQRFLKDITEPHLIAKTHPRQAELTASVNEVAGEMMRRILHHPDFQALESLWRGLYFLVRRLDTDENLKIYLLDVSKEELAADLMSSEDLSKTDIYKILSGEAGKTLGRDPWAVVAGLYRFSDEADDVQLLGRMAKIAMAAGAPFVSSADDMILGCKSLAQTPDPDEWRETDGRQAWDALRALPEARYLGLALPRFLLRLPYGEKTEPLESFPFEEMPGRPVHEDYLWGNPSLACVCLLGRSFIADGWTFQVGQVMDIKGLPLHVYKDQGESVAAPLAEVVLTEKAAQIILDKGLLLLISYKNGDAIRLALFQSLADPPCRLGGRWG
jgi:type VI secretion system protein ImpC